MVMDFNLYLFNTVVRYAIPYVFGVLLSNTLVAYSFGRLKWPGRDFLFALCLMTMMIPGQVTMVPMFIIFKTLGWVNSYKPLIIPSFFASAYWIFMLRQFFRTIPEELSDAARIDGAGEFQTLWYIILPLVKPALAVVGLFSFMDAWNNYMGPLIYINQSNLFPLSLGLASLGSALSQVGIKGLAYPYLMAVSTLVTLPIILIFFFAQRTFIEGIALTGLKG
jgi:ABC-type glycerol-3-phosphate transport system permease component